MWLLSKPRVTPKRVARSENGNMDNLCSKSWWFPCPREKTEKKTQIHPGGQVISNSPSLKAAPKDTPEPIWQRPHSFSYEHWQTDAEEASKLDPSKCGSPKNTSGGFTLHLSGFRMSRCTYRKPCYRNSIAASSWENDGVREPEGPGPGFLVGSLGKPTGPKKWVKNDAKPSRSSSREVRIRVPELFFLCSLF